MNQGLSPGNMRDAATFTRDKMKSRRRRNILGATGAALGVGGGIALGLGALGVGAAMATPIGWGLAAAAGAVGLGLGAYKLYRWAKKRRQKGTGQGLGEERERHATNIHNAINARFRGSFNHPVEVRRREAIRVLKARGVDPGDVRGRKGKEVLKEKMASW